MSLVTKLASTTPLVIKEALFSLLDETTDPAILQLDKEFRASDDRIKYAFLAEFEASDTRPTLRSPALLERWTHYCWIRLELSYLINQRATLNKIRETKRDINQLMQDQDELEPNLPAMLDSVGLAIQEDALKGVPIEKSIAVIRQMMLQVVGTEHPTDPLSQKARDMLTKIANAIASQEPDETTIKKLLLDLQTIDAIPPSKRSVVEEVGRNINITLDKLYDNLPHLVQELLDSYKKYYGEAAYETHEAEIIQAIQGGIMPNNTLIAPLVRDASWPAFDADGNENITATTMSMGIRLQRIEVAEKHIATIKSTIVKSAKKIERELREKTVMLNSDFFELLLTDEHVKANLQIIHDSRQFQDQASLFLIDRKFVELVDHYQKFKKSIENLPIEEEKKAQLLKVIAEQAEIANTIIALTQFSGHYSENGHLQNGDVQEFKKIFSNYKNAIRENTDAIRIKNGQGQSQVAAEFVVSKFNKLRDKHQNLLKTYPELGKQMRDFGILLHCFGMTYGVGHIRQDSSIFMKVWDTILSDLKTENPFTHYALFKSMQGKSYLDLTEEERVALHKQLQNGSAESKKILDTLFHKQKDSNYSSQEKYKNNPEFSLVRAELDRFELTTRHEDMFENIIISNCESAANILEVESLLSIFPKRTSLTIVPLLEKRQDLEKYETILTDYIKLKIQQKLEADFDQENNLKERLGIQDKSEIKPWIEAKNRHDFKAFLKQNRALAPYLANITIEIMVGFSDTERVSGLSALIAVQQVQEDFINLTSDFGVSPKIYHGPGGDPNRGGLKRRDQKGTLQGNARSNVLNTTTSADWFRENQFYHTYKLLSDPAKKMEFAKLPEPMKASLANCMKAGTGFYENLHDTKAGLGKLMGLLLGYNSFWMVTILNSSSRATQRGITEGIGDRTASVQSNAKGMRTETYIHPDKPRAISATQMKEMLRDNLDFIGSAYGLRAISQKEVERLYDLSETFRDMVAKDLMGAATRDLSFTAHVLFADHPHRLPKDDNQRKEWAAECRDSYPDMLKKLDIEKMSKNPENREQLLGYLSRFFAYIEEECIQTQAFLFELNRSINRIAFKNADPDNATDLLSHCPDWQQQTNNILLEVKPLSFILARLSHHVAMGKYVDKIYEGLNEQTIPDSKLSGVGRLIGNVGAGLTAYRIMPPGFTENSSHDIRQDLRLGVTRAEQEVANLERDTTVRNHQSRSVLRFFSPETVKNLDDTLQNQRNQSQENRMY